MNTKPANPSSALEAESTSPGAATSVDPVPVVAPTPPIAPVLVMVSEPVVASDTAPTALASVASGPSNAPVPDAHHDLVTSPAATSASSSAHSSSVAQSALALAAALRDAGPSIPNETLVSYIITAFIRTGPKPPSAGTPMRNFTESATPGTDIEVRLKELETRVDLAIAKFDESLLKLSAEQKRLENLGNEKNTHGTGTRLAYLKRKIAELGEATSELM